MHRHTHAHTAPTAHASQWAPLASPTSEHNIYCTVQHILDSATQLHAGSPVEIQHWLTLYMDRFLPLMNFMEESGMYTDAELCTDTGDVGGAPIEKHQPCTPMHTGLLPNYASKLLECSFWSDNTKQSAIVHLLSKSTPQRCQIRSLAHIVYNYARMHNDVYVFLRNILQCSLLGTYSGCQRPNTNRRRDIYSVFATMEKHQFLQWLKQGHQQLLFFTMKEYLIFAAHAIPSLREELVLRYNWREFETTVRQTMNGVRQRFTDMKFVGVETQLMAITKTHTSTYRQIKHPFIHVLQQEFEYSDESNGVSTRVVRTEDIDLLYAMLIRTVTERIPFEWLVFFGTTEDQCHKLGRIYDQFHVDGAKTGMRQFLKKVDPDTNRALRALVVAYERKVNIRMFTLPAHIVTRQIRALRRLYCVPDGEPAPPMGNSMICLQCKQFKGFVVHKHPKTNEPVNLFAYGHSKVLIDDVTKKLYCGRRCDRTDKKRVNETNQWDLDAVVLERQVKRQAKEQRKEQENALCVTQSLVNVALLGNMLQFYDKLYTVCPQCANFMNFDARHHVADSFYCGCCLENGQAVMDIACERCGDRQQLGDPILVASGESIYLCRTHYKPWIREASAVLEKATILRGLEEKWKRLQSI